ASTTSPCISTLPSLSATRLQWLGRARPRVGGRARGSASAGEDDVGRLRAFLTLLGYELDLRALGERLEALARDAAEMDEEVFAAVVRGDEPIPLGVIEPLHGSGCHLSKTPPCLDSRTGRKVQEHARPDHALIERWESSSDSVRKTGFRRRGIPCSRSGRLVPADSARSRPPLRGRASWSSACCRRVSADFSSWRTRSRVSSSTRPISSSVRLSW